MDTGGCDDKDLGDGHIVNRMLPSTIRTFVDEDLQQKYNEVVFNLKKLEEAETASAKDIVLCLRVIESAVSLKFKFSIEDKSRIVNTLLTVSSQSHVTRRMKARIYGTISIFTGRKSDNLTISFPWKPIWEDALSVATRQSKFENMASDFHSKFLKSAAGLLYDSRRYFHPNNPEMYTEIIKNAMEKLSNRSTILCVEGLLELVNLVPDEYGNYDDYLAQWYQIWVSIPRNVYWDFWWLKLFCRARKFSKNFDWSIMFDTLLDKVLEYSTDTDMTTISVFPRGVPVHYTRLCPKVSNHDAKATIIQKLSKLIYFVMIKENSLISSGNIVEYPPISCTPFQFPTVINSPSGETILFHNSPSVIGYNAPLRSSSMNKYTAKVCQFFETNRHLFHPSSSLKTVLIPYFLTTIVGQILRHKTFIFSNDLMAAQDIQSSSDFVYKSGVIYELPIHEESNNYLIGFCCGLALELLFGRFSTANSVAINVIRNICLINRDYVHFFLPHMFSALDIESVSQAHLLNPSLLVIENIFSNFVFPDMSLLVKYIPPLLRLLLPGVDSNDFPKTSRVCSLINTIISKVPIRENYNDVIKSFRQIISSEHSSYGSSDFDFYAKSMRDHQTLMGKNSFYDTGDSLDSHYKILSSYWPEFLNSLFDRIILVLQSIELPVDNDSTKAGSRVQKITSSQKQQIEQLNELFMALFQSIDQPESSLRLKFESKVIEFVQSCTIMKANKLFAKLIGAMVYSNSSCLKSVLSALIDEDLINLQYPMEKTCFRLQLIGSACKFASSKALTSINVFQQLQPFFVPDFIEHKEKCIRIAVNKLIKNSFRGALSYYPLSYSSCPNVLKSDGEISAGIFGHPLNTRLSWTNVEGDHLTFWNEPDKDSVSYALQYFRPLVELCFNKTQGAQSNLSISDVSNQKKIEDQLNFYLLLLTNLLIAASDLLGNDLESKVQEDLSFTPNSPENLDVNDDDDDDEDEEDEGSSYYPTYLLHTGREIFFGADSKSSLDEADKGFLLSLRKNVLNMQFSMLQSFNRADESSNISDLLNNQIIMELWVELFATVVNRRYSAKPIPLTPVQYSPFNIIMRKQASYRVKSNDNIDKVLQSRFLDYWHFIQVPIRYFQSIVWQHHRFRISSFASASIRLQLLNSFSDSSLEESALIVKLFYVLNILCGHEYDIIRQDATRCFQSCFKKFSPILKNLINDVLEVLKGNEDSRFLKCGFMNFQGKNDKAIYSMYSGCLATLQNPPIMKRICSNWDLTASFLKASTNFDQIEAKLTDNEKMRKLSVEFTNTFHCYATGWSHHPLKTQETVGSIFSTVLGRLGFSSSTVNPTASNFSMNVPTTNGIRQSAILMYIVLHFTGHCDIKFDTNIWRCIVHYMNLGQGMPAQSMAFSAFFRLLFRIYKKDAVRLLKEFGEFGEVDTSVGKKFISTIVTDDTVTFLRDLYVSGSETSSTNADSNLSPSDRRKNAWSSLFNAIYTTKDTSDDDATSKVSSFSSNKKRWTHGIDGLLHLTHAILLSLPRKEYFPLAVNDKNLYSTWFDTENSVMIESLIASKILFDDAFLPIELFKELFEVLSTIGKSKTNQAELRAINCAKAEIFAGFYRSFRRLKFEDQSNSRLKSDSEWKEYEDVLSSFFSSNISKASKDYGNDWTGAIYFALSDNILLSAEEEASGSIVRAIDGGLEWLSQPVPETSISESEENITFKVHSINLHEAKLLADMSRKVIRYSVNQDSISHSSLPLKNVLETLQNVPISNLLSPFNPIRESLARYLSTISAVVSLEIPEHLGLLDSFLSRIMDHFASLKSKLNEVLDASKLRESASEHEEDDANIKSIRLKLLHLYHISFWWLAFTLMRHSFPLNSSSIWMLRLFELVLDGCSCQEPDIAGQCNLICLKYIQIFATGVHETASNVLDQAIHLLKKMAISNSYQTRLAAVNCLQKLMYYRYSKISPELRLVCKDIVYDRMINDSKLDVQQGARNAMITYLSHKTFAEMVKIAAAYTKNCDSLAHLDASRRKLKESKGLSVEQDNSMSGTSAAITTNSINRNMENEMKNYITNILMASCVILRYPFDVPQFLPALLSAFMKHLNINSAVLEVAKSCIRDFRRTHADRWKDFQLLFSRELLDDFQGSGSVHYFA